MDHGSKTKARFHRARSIEAPMGPTLDQRLWTKFRALVAVVGARRAHKKRSAGHFFGGKDTAWNQLAGAHFFEGMNPGVPFKDNTHRGWCIGVIPSFPAEHQQVNLAESFLSFAEHGQGPVPLA